MVWTISVAFIAFLVMWRIAVGVGIKVQDSNRKKEWEANESSEILSEQQLHWTIVHIRDDLGLIATLLAFVVGLLSALTVIVLVK